MAQDARYDGEFLTLLQSQGRRCKDSDRQERERRRRRPKRKDQSIAAVARPLIGNARTDPFPVTAMTSDDRYRGPPSALTYNVLWGLTSGPIRRCHVRAGGTSVQLSGAERNTSRGQALRIGVLSPPMLPIRRRDTPAPSGSWPRWWTGCIDVDITSPCSPPAIRWSTVTWSPPSRAASGRPGTEGTWVRT